MKFRDERRGIQEAWWTGIVAQRAVTPEFVQWFRVAERREVNEGEV